MLMSEKKGKNPVSLEVVSIRRSGEVTKIVPPPLSATP